MRSGAWLRHAVLGLVAVLFGGLSGLCLLVAALDFSYHGDTWDGIAGDLALVVVGPCLVLTAGSVGSLPLARRHPVAGQVLSGVVGLLLVALSVLTLRTSQWAVVPLVLGVTLLALLPSREPGGAR